MKLDVFVYTNDIGLCYPEPNLTFNMCKLEKKNENMKKRRTNAVKNNRNIVWNCVEISAECC